MLRLKIEYLGNILHWLAFFGSEDGGFHFWVQLFPDRNLRVFIYGGTIPGQKSLKGCAYCY